MTPEEAFAEAAAQMRRRTGAWSSRAVFWAAVRAGADTLALPWAEAAERWTRLWAVASQEHLPPIPGAVHIGAPPDVAKAEQNLERMRAMTGARRR